MRLCGAVLALAVLALPSCGPQADPGPAPEISELELPRNDWPPNPFPDDDDVSGSRAAALLESLKDKPGFISSEANLTRIDAFVRGAVEFVLYHELAHMLVTDHGIPNPGGRPGGEIASDRFAAFAMTPSPRPAGAPREMLDPAAGGAPAVVWAAGLWRQEQRLLDAGGEPYDWADEHGLPEQRLHQVLCLIYGAEPARWIEQSAFAQAVPEGRREICIAEAADNAAFWRMHVMIHMDASVDAALRYDPVVVYEPAPGTMANLQGWFAATGLLERLAETISSFKAPEGAGDAGRTVTIVGSPCEVNQGYISNAFWDPDARALVMCYPLIADFESLAVGMLGALPRETQENPIPDR